MMNYWRILQLSPTKDKEQIKAAYLALIGELDLYDDIEDYQDIYLAYRMALRAVEQGQVQESPTQEELERTETKNQFSSDDFERLLEEAPQVFSEEEVNDWDFWKERLEGHDEAQLLVFKEIVNHLSLMRDVPTLAALIDLVDFADFDLDSRHFIQEKMFERLFELLGEEEEQSPEQTPSETDFQDETNDWFHDLQEHADEFSEEPDRKLVATFSAEQVNDQEFWQERIAQNPSDIRWIFEEVQHHLTMISNRETMRYLYDRSFEHDMDLNFQEELRQEMRAHIRDKILPVQVNDKQFWEERFKKEADSLRWLFEDVLEECTYISNLAILRMLHRLSYNKQLDEHFQVKVRDRLVEQFRKQCPEWEKEEKRRLPKMIQSYSSYFLFLCNAAIVGAFIFSGYHPFLYPFMAFVFIDTNSLIKTIKSRSYYLHDDLKSYRRLQYASLGYVFLILLFSFIIFAFLSMSWLNTRIVIYWIIISLVLLFYRVILAKLEINYHLQIDYLKWYTNRFPYFAFYLLWIPLLIYPLFHIGDLTNSDFIYGEAGIVLTMLSAWFLQYVTLDERHWGTAPVYLFLSQTTKRLFYLECCYLFVLLRSDWLEKATLFNLYLLFFGLIVLFSLPMKLIFRRMVQKGEAEKWPQHPLILFLKSFRKKEKE